MPLPRRDRHRPPVALASGLDRSDMPGLTPFASHRSSIAAAGSRVVRSM